MLGKLYCFADYARVPNHALCTFDRATRLCRFKLRSGNRGVQGPAGQMQTAMARLNVKELPEAGRCGGQGLVAFATVDREAVARAGTFGDCADARSLALWTDVAIKFHFDRHAYEHEKSLASDPRLASCLPTILYSSNNEGVCCS